MTAAHSDEFLNAVIPFLLLQPLTDTRFSLQFVFDDKPSANSYSGFDGAVNT